MSTQNFSKKEAITFGWLTTKKHFWFFAQVIGIILLISYGPGVIMESFDRIELPTLVVIFFFLIGILFWGLQLLVSIGIIRIALSYVAGKKAEINQLFSGTRYILNYFAGSIVYGFLVAGGLLLLIVPGIIFAVKFQFYQYLIVDKNMGPIEALKISWDITDGSFWNLLLFWLLIIGINLLGVLALVVGLFVSIPVTILASAWVYRTLSRRAHA